MFRRALPLVLVLWVLPTGASAQATLPARCVASCQRHVTDRALRAQVCGGCLNVSGGDRASWIALLEKKGRASKGILQSALTDRDWAVRYGALEALARAQKLPVGEVWSAWVQERGAEAIATAWRAAAKGRVAVRSLFSGPKALSASTRCSAARASVIEALEVELYETEPLVQREALAHLAVIKGVKPARVVLEAMASRPAATDKVVARLMLELASSSDQGTGFQLLSVAEKDDEAQVNRLFAVWSEELDQARPQLRDGERAVRHDAIRDFGFRGPLGDVDLAPLLDHEEADTRLAAARALARGAGLSFVEAAKRKIEKGSEAEQLKWMEVLGRSGADGCLVALEPAAKAASVAVRAGAYRAIGICAGEAAMAWVEPGLRDPDAEVRAGAIDALASMPRSKKARDLLDGFGPSEAPVVLAACVKSRAVLRHGEPSAGLFRHASPLVRRAVAESVALGASRGRVAEVTALLRADPDAGVRAAAAKALWSFGGPQSISALAHAAKQDPDGTVRHLSQEGLKRLGFHP